MRSAPSTAHRFDTLPEGEKKRQAVRQMFDSIAPRYDVMNKAMTFGLDSYWRRRALSLARLEAGATVLDLACGTGDFARLLASRQMEAIGLDYSGGMLARARTARASLCEGDAASMPFRDGSFDGLVSGFALRNFSDLAGTFAEIARVLRPAGRLALLEVAEPKLPLLRQVHGIWFNSVVPRLGAFSSDPAAYGYLPKSVAYLPPPAAMLEMLEQAGFYATRRHLLTGGVVQVLTARKR